MQMQWICLMDREKIFSSLVADVSENDVVISITKNNVVGFDVCLTSKTIVGIEFMTWLVLKWGHIVEFKLRGTA